MTPGAMLAAVGEQTRPNVLPDRMRAVEPDRVRALDRDGAEATQALDAQLLARDLGEAPGLVPTIGEE